VIVTVTPNPSLDRTVTLATPLTRGAVHRVSSVTTEPGGKGVNVARALSLAGVDAVALLPASGTDPMVTALQGSGVPFRCVPITASGAPMDAAAIDGLTRAVVSHAEYADWVVMSGSLPPGMPDTWYADVVAKLAPYACKVAIDTSDRPLAALVAGFDRAAPDLIKPNAEELAGVIGYSPQALEAAVAQGDPDPVVAAAQRLVDRGVGAVLATLGAAGAVLVTDAGSWLAIPPPTVPRSTVGAGDSSLAGYVLADIGGADPPHRLQMAVGYGSAAAALPGSALPTPSEIDLNAVRVTPISSVPPARTSSASS
jgi:1-phosphofructokinase